MSDHCTHGRLTFWPELLELISLSARSLTLDTTREHIMPKLLFKEKVTIGLDVLFIHFVVLVIIIELQWKPHNSNCVGMG